MQLDQQNFDISGLLSNEAKAMLSSMCSQDIELKLTWMLEVDGHHVRYGSSLDEIVKQAYEDWLDRKND
jgi:hypothetical protein